MTKKGKVCSKIVNGRILSADGRELPDKTRTRYWDIMSLCKHTNTTTNRILIRVIPLYKKYGDTWLWDVKGTPDDFWFAENERDTIIWLRNFRSKPWFGQQPDASETFYWKYQTYALTRKNEGCKYWYDYFLTMNDLYGKNWIWEVIEYNLHDKDFIQEIRANIIETWYNEHPELT